MLFLELFRWPENPVIVRVLLLFMEISKIKDFRLKSIDWMMTFPWSLDLTITF